MNDFYVWLMGFWMNRREWYRGYYLNTSHWRNFIHWRKYSKFGKWMGWDKCKDCGKKEYGLHTHHLTYAHLWMENIFPFWFDVITLCNLCHNKRHQ